MHGLAQSRQSGEGRIVDNSDYYVVKCQTARQWTLNLSIQTYNHLVKQQVLLHVLVGNLLCTL